MDEILRKLRACRNLPIYFRGNEIICHWDTSNGTVRIGDYQTGDVVDKIWLLDILHNEELNEGTVKELIVGIEVGEEDANNFLITNIKEKKTRINLISTDPIGGRND